MRAFLTLKGIVGGALVAAFALVAIVTPFVIAADRATQIEHAWHACTRRRSRIRSAPTSSGANWSGACCSAPTPRW